MVVSCQQCCQVILVQQMVFAWMVEMADTRQHCPFVLHSQEYSKGRDASELGKWGGYKRMRLCFVHSDVMDEIGVGIAWSVLLEGTAVIAQSVLESDTVRD